MIIGFQKKYWIGGWVGGVSSIQMLFGCLEFFLTLQHPLYVFEHFFFGGEGWQHSILWLMKC